jgi:SSS family solute:Na+ symporter
VPQFLGIFWKRGNQYAAIGSMSAGFITAVWLEIQYPGSIPWAFGLTSGAVALLLNLVIYVVVSLLIPQTPAEKQRVQALFDMIHHQKAH